LEEACANDGKADSVYKPVVYVQDDLPRRDNDLPQRSPLHPEGRHVCQGCTQAVGLFLRAITRGFGLLSPHRDNVVRQVNVHSFPQSGVRDHFAEARVLSQSQGGICAHLVNGEVPVAVLDLRNYPDGLQGAPRLLG
jgi:hypothetical protein